jgi:fructose-1,6-bisphosphatase II
VDYIPRGAKTDSIVLRGLTGTVRRIQATHRLDKLDKISRVKY